MRSIDELEEFDKAEYKNIPMMEWLENKCGDIPVFFRRYEGNESMGYCHRHKQFQINYVKRGAPDYIILGTLYHLVKGDIHIIPPYVPHCLAPQQGANFEIIEVEFLPDFILPDFIYIEPFLVTESDIRPRINLSGPDQDLAETLLTDFQEEYQMREDMYLLMVKAILLRLLTLLSRCSLKSEGFGELTDSFVRRRRSIERALAFINKNFSSPITTEEAADVAMMSVSYFSSMFRAFNGKTFTEYLNDLRVRKAMERLKKTADTVTDICFETGFTSIPTFNRTFKSVAGLSPSQYRKANRI
ncbi:MAG: AraC family transcriptional regulator [Spirochaetaceae bacterium]|jgi:AraC-like DNA-binding protein|nr:AraC family transcriptional regulator [Spirochaetaceae bacterium]